MVKHVLKQDPNKIHITTEMQDAIESVLFKANGYGEMEWIAVDSFKELMLKLSILKPEITEDIVMAYFTNSNYFTRGTIWRIVCGDYEPRFQLATDLLDKGIWISSHEIGQVMEELSSAIEANESSKEAKDFIVHLMTKLVKGELNMVQYKMLDKKCILDTKPFMGSVEED